MRTRFRTLSSTLRSGSEASRSWSATRMAGRASAYGRTVWQETHAVSWSRAAIGQASHHDRRPRRYPAAARGFHEATGCAAAWNVEAARHAITQVANAKTARRGFMRKKGTRKARRARRVNGGRDGVPGDGRTGANCVSCSVVPLMTEACRPGARYDSSDSFVAECRGLFAARVVRH